MRTYLLIFLSSLVFLFVFGWIVKPVRAQETTPLQTQNETTSFTPEPTPAPTVPPSPETPLNLSVSPITINLETDPGQSTTSPLKVLNNGLKTEYLHIELATFKPDGTGSLPVISDFGPNDEYQKWLTVSEENFTVSPKEWKTLNVHFSPPSDAALGYYYVIIVSRQTNTPTAPGTSAIIGAPAVLILARVNSPNTTPELQVAEFKSKKRVYEFLPAEFEIAVKNTGNIHLAPIGNIFIDQGDKNDIGILSINPGGGLVLPDSSRTYTVTWNEGFPVYKTVSEDGKIVTDKAGKEVKKLSWDFSTLSQFKFGKYTAHLLLIYDNGQRDIPIESELSFWVIPWRIIGAILGMTTVLLSGLLFPVLFIIRKAKKKKIR